MMYADMKDLAVLSAMFPSWSWRLAVRRRVFVASEGPVIRLYWMPALLSLDEFRAQLFVKELNALGASGGSSQGEWR